MISVVIPTRNRAYTLALVLPSYFEQDLVEEIILVDDAGEDPLEDHLPKAFPQEFASGRIRILRHADRRGASAGRITGYRAAKCEYVLFGEDDAYLESGYAGTLLAKLQADRRLGLVSGRIIYLLPSETPIQAKERFGQGMPGVAYLDPGRFSYRMDAWVGKDVEVPFTHAIFLARKDLLERIGYDPFYSKGNGFREETDFQVAALLQGHRILLTVDTRCYHMNKKDVPTGGQRSSRLRQLRWNVFYTSYFFGKYHEGLVKAGVLRGTLAGAKAKFALLEVHRLFLLPWYKLAKLCVSRS